MRPAPIAGGSTKETEARVGEGYRTFDHTGDLGLEVWSDAAEALLAQIAIPKTGQIEVRTRLELSGEDPRDVLVHWLNTVLLRAELEHAVWVRATVESLTPRSIRATLEGPRLDPDRDVLLREVKAVSHHDLLIELQPGNCRCRLVLDI
jgi:SHS2 domain-containing protein